ncbi:hypothetical protein ACG83_14355 [Frankia sp. R43]|uniref:hypothetical protein n=1 Tax=Frankia sp. R43 TaxID=269536 RepID=UPI0006CA5CCD|nr:hypothetical protein [Frankia sp. R43]KPM54654.1 hypothetical protein ACG83_14355 [Frankia sp. R43]
MPLLALLLLAVPIIPAVGAGPVGRAEATSAPGTAQAAGAAQPPAGTVSRTGSFLTDTAGRVVLPRGVTVPAGTVPTAADMARWIDYGFTGSRIEVPMTAGGRFPPNGERPPAGDPEQGGLEQVGAVVRDLTDHGLFVVIGIVPGSAGYTPSTSDLAAGLRRLAGRFGAVGGLIGFEVPTSTAAEDLAATLRSSDPNHTLWVAQAAPFDPAARVAANGAAGYITGWADGSRARVGALADAGDVFNLGWFYDEPVTGRPRTGIGAGQVRAAATPPAEVVRPYPAAVAGIPESYGSDASGVFRLTYRTSSAVRGAFPAGTATAIVVPGWSYSSGYQVRVTGGQVTSAPGAGVLCVVASAGAAEVSVEVAPAAGAAPVAPARAGAVNCSSGAAHSAQATQGSRAADDAAADDAAAGEAAAGGGGGAGVGSGGGDDADSPLLLLVLPLLGAALTAAVLGPLFLRLRRR